jgi:hypothetical protein
MKQAVLGGILKELRQCPGLPDEIYEKIDEVERTLMQLSEHDFAQWTDGVVTSSGQTEVPDLRYKVYDLYAALNEHVRELRGEEPESLRSLLNRLQGQVDGYDRDFP